MSEVTWTRTPTVLWRRTPATLVRLDTDEGAPVTVGGPAADLWTLLDEPTTLAEATELLAEAYSADPNQVRDDLARMLEDLEARGLVIRT